MLNRATQEPHISNFKVFLLFCVCVWHLFSKQNLCKSLTQRKTKLV